MKTALVLSGGGAKGSFQVGAIKALLELGYTFDVVSGVSVGSLNGCMVAQGKYEEMFNVWKNLREEDVFLRPNFLRIAWDNLIGDKKSLYVLDPLMEILKRVVIKKDDFKVPFYIGITSLATRKYYSKCVDDFDTEQDLRDGIFASSLMPILWEPTTVRTKQEVIRAAVDGGLKNVVPFKDILKEQADRIILIQCNNTDIPYDEDEPKKIWDVALRTFLEMMIDEIVKNDVDKIELVNNLVGVAAEDGYALKFKKGGRTLKHFELIKIRPPYRVGESTDFSRESIEANYKLGYETAMSMLKK